MSESSRIETEQGLVESLIQSIRSIPETHLTVPATASFVDVTKPKPLLVLWDDSHQLTQFILKWETRPKPDPFAEIFKAEFIRRKGLRAYGVRLPQRRSKINQIRSSSVTSLVPRQLSAPVGESPIAETPAEMLENLSVA